MLMGCIESIRKIILYAIGFIFSHTVRKYVEQSLNSLLIRSTSDVSSLSDTESLDNPLLSALYVDPEIITV